MKCNYKPKTESRMQTLMYILHAVAISLFDIGLDGEKVQAVLENIQGISSSIVDDGMKYRDVRRALKEEYDFEIVG